MEGGETWSITVKTASAVGTGVTWEPREPRATIYVRLSLSLSLAPAVAASRRLSRANALRNPPPRRADQRDTGIDVSILSKARSPAEWKIVFLTNRVSVKWSTWLVIEIWRKTSLKCVTVGYFEADLCDFEADVVRHGSVLAWLGISFWLALVLRMVDTAKASWYLISAG